jgi:hypothetical protein
MKTNYKLLNTAVAVLLFSMTSWSQATIAHWNFNGAAADAIPGGTNSPTVATGAGTAALVGGTTATFASGNTTTGTTETEATSPPNFGWNTTTYPAAGQENKMRGVQFNVSTVGQADITFKFEQRLSNTAANTYVVQYTSNASAGAPVWVDAQTFSVTPAATGTGDTWYNARSVDLSAVAALDNNPSVAFRVVSAFDPVANDYLAARSTSTYAGGTVRFDQVTVTSATTLGVGQFETANNSFRIFPNPAHNEVVNFSEAHDIEVYDTMGKVILKAKNAASVDTKNFTTGVYFIKTETGATQKLIVK